MATEPTAVTNLTAVATSNQSIRVTWDLPVYPNAPVMHYNLYYRASDTPQQPPDIRSDGYTNIMVMNTDIDITGLVPFTNYTIHVQAVGQGGQGSLLGSIDEEILQRTNSTTQIIAVDTTTPTNEPTSVTINVRLPDPDQVETGPVM